jgi:hypothetical protein
MALLTVATLAVAAAAGIATAAEAPATAPQADKSQYTLFNPTPTGLMRELNPDRPDTTESPFTVDAGHIQVELSFAEWSKDSGLEQLSILPFNFKIGLTNFADLQLGFGPYNRLHGFSRTDEGMSDAFVRLKWNIWGNEGGGPWSTAFAIMPFVNIPTGADAFTGNALQGGVILPLSISLPGEFDLGAMAEFDFVRDGTGGRDTLLVHTVTLGHDIVKDLGAYIEYVGIVDLDGDQRYQAYFDTGLKYNVSENVQFDVGVSIGINSAAQDLAVFAGMTFRI